MTNKQWIILSVVTAVAVFAVIFIGNALSGSKKPDSVFYDKYIESQEMRIAELKERNAAEAEFRKEQRGVYQDAMRADSVALAAFLKNQTKYAAIKKERNEIPAYIKSIGDRTDSINNAIDKFLGNQR